MCDINVTSLIILGRKQLSLEDTEVRFSVAMVTMIYCRLVQETALHKSKLCYGFSIISAVYVWYPEQLAQTCFK